MIVVRCEELYNGMRLFFIKIYQTMIKFDLSGSFFFFFVNSILKFSSKSGCLP